MDVFDAAVNGNIAQLQAFIQGGGNISTPRKADLERSPLHLAIYQQKTRAAELLVTLGADVSARDYRKCTPLHYAAGIGLSGLVELLLSKGADAKALDTFGENALHHLARGGGCASEKEQVAILQRLITAGVDPDSIGNANRTPLYYAAARGKFLTTKELLKCGADPLKVAGGELGTPIDAASRAGHKEVEALLKG
jgi:ankyrin repeat protein